MRILIAGGAGMAVTKVAAHMPGIFGLRLAGFSQIPLESGTNALTFNATRSKAPQGGPRHV